MRKVSKEEFSPIPKEDLTEWNSLIKKGKALVGKRDKSIWELVLLTGQVQTKYGEHRIKRFADEIDLSVKTIYEYRWLNRAGVNREFVDEWGSKLSFTMIRTIMRHTGRIDADATMHFLQYASERKVTVRAMEAYMLETIAPNEYQKRVGEEMRLALMHKQEAEGFDDYVRYKLEQLVEEEPEMASIIMKHSVVSNDDLEALMVEAGIRTDEEVEMASKGKRSADKIKRYYRHLNEVKNNLKEHLAYGHENSDEIRLQLQKLKDITEEILQTEQRQIDVEADVVQLKGDKVKS